MMNEFRKTVRQRRFPPNDIHNEDVTDVNCVWTRGRATSDGTCPLGRKLSQEQGTHPATHPASTYLQELFDCIWKNSVDEEVDGVRG